MNNEEQRRKEGEPDRAHSEETPVGDDPRAEEVPDEAADDVEEVVEEVPAETVEAGEAEPEVTPELPPDAFDGVTEEAAGSEEEILALTAELEEARRERDEYYNDMLRMKAEMENARKRLERDRARFSQLASERLVRELLPVLDNMERALEVEGDIREGVRATRDGLLAALAREGLEPVISDGEDFDPSVHEAVMGQPSDQHEEDTVIQTLERGYTLNGRAIRPAKVIVAKQV